MRIHRSQQTEIFDINECYAGGQKVVNNFVQFPYSVSDSDAPREEVDSLPRLPLTLEHENKTVEVIGLVNSGATVNVLPYHLGIDLGAIWIEEKATLPLAGNLGNSHAHPLLVLAHIADFPPIRLAFAWTKLENTPLILGQTNFFMEFDVCFYRSLSKFGIRAVGAKSL